MPYDQIYWNGGGGFEDPGEYITSAQQRMVVGKTASSHPDSAFTAHPAVEDADNLLTVTPVSDYLAVTGSREGYSNNPAYADFIADNSNDTFFMGVHDSNRISVTHAGIPYNGCRLILRTEFGYAAGRPTFTTNLVGGSAGEDNLVESFDFKSDKQLNEIIQKKYNKSEIIISFGLFLIEILGLCIKHLILAVRLLANMVAGHLVLLGIMGLITAAASASTGTWATVTVISVLSATLFSVLELFVAFLQAYIFTFLSALFVGAAVHHH